MRGIIGVSLILILQGCAFDPSVFDTEPEIQVVQVDKPLLYCPAPTAFTYPRLVIESLVPGDEKDPGRVAQFYKAVVKQLEGEIKARDKVLKAYADIGSVNPNLSPVEVDAIFKDLLNEKNGKSTK
jgi:hypothetical protein